MTGGCDGDDNDVDDFEDVDNDNDVDDIEDSDDVEDGDVAILISQSIVILSFSFSNASFLVSLPLRLVNSSLIMLSRSCFALFSARST